MPNAFSQEERVDFDESMGRYEDMLAMAGHVSFYRTDQTMMARTRDVFWRTRKYILNSFSGMDQSANFLDKTQLSVPVSINVEDSVPWILDAKELRDRMQEGGLASASIERLASNLNVRCLQVVQDLGSLTVSRSGSPGGFADVAAIDTVMNQRGVPRDRGLALTSAAYNGMADNLAVRSTMTGKPATAYESGYVGPVASFETWKLDYGLTLTPAAGVGVTINEGTAANRRLIPRATSTGSGGQVSNVDNRFMQITVAVTSGTMKVGDRFRFTGVNAVHNISKADTGQPLTHVITRLVTGAGGSGIIEFTPPLIPADSSPTQAEIQYKNCTVTPANGAALVFLNTVSTQPCPFWQKNAVEIVPGRYEVPGDGVSVLRASTKQGMEVTATKWFDIKTYKWHVRYDSLYGVNMPETEMGGLLLFNQT